jgi:hypothetical protein
MSDNAWLDTLKTLAPTVATALGGPLAGAAVTALGSVFGVSAPTVDKIGQIFQDGQLTADHLAEIRKLELQYQNDEKERGIKYAELEFKDRDSARQMAAQTHALTPSILTWIVVASFLTIEGGMLLGIDVHVDDIVLGRILGTLDTSLGLVLAYWFGSSSGSHQKDVLIANASVQGKG